MNFVLWKVIFRLESCKEASGRGVKGSFLRLDAERASRGRDKSKESPPGRGGGERGAVGVKARNTPDRGGGERGAVGAEARNPPDWKSNEKTAVGEDVTHS